MQLKHIFVVFGSVTFQYGQYGTYY